MADMQQQNPSASQPVGQQPGTQPQGMWNLANYSTPSGTAFGSASIPTQFQQASFQSTPQYQAPTYQTYQYSQPQAVAPQYSQLTGLAGNLAQQAGQYAQPNIPAMQEQAKGFYQSQADQQAQQANADYAARGMSQSGALGGQLQNIQNQATQNIGSAYNQINTTAPQIAVQNLLAASQGANAAAQGGAALSFQDIANLMQQQQAQGAQNLGGAQLNLSGGLGAAQLNQQQMQALNQLGLQQTQGLNQNQLAAAQLGVGQQQALNQLNLQQLLGLGQLNLQGTTAANQLNVQQSLGLQQLANQLALTGMTTGTQQNIANQQIGLQSALGGANQDQNSLSTILQLLGGS